MFRAMDTACDGTLDSVTEVTSIGDRLLFPYYEQGVEVPLTMAGAKAHSPPYVDLHQDCMANMGHHWVAPMASVYPVIPMYYEKSGDIVGLLLADPINKDEPSPPYEKFAEYNNAKSLHVYFKDHMGACEK